MQVIVAIAAQFQSPPAALAALPSTLGLMNLFWILPPLDRNHIPSLENSRWNKERKWCESTSYRLPSEFISILQTRHLPNSQTLDPTDCQSHPFTPKLTPPIVCPTLKKRQEKSEVKPLWACFLMHQIVKRQYGDTFVPLRPSPPSWFPFHVL